MKKIKPIFKNWINDSCKEMARVLFESGAKTQEEMEDVLISLVAIPPIGQQVSGNTGLLIR